MTLKDEIDKLLLNPKTTVGKLQKLLLDGIPIQDNDNHLAECLWVGMIMLNQTPIEPERLVDYSFIKRLKMITEIEHLQAYIVKLEDHIKLIEKLLNEALEKCSSS